MLLVGSGDIAIGWQQYHCYRWWQYSCIITPFLFSRQGERDWHCSIFVVRYWYKKPRHLWAAVALLLLSAAVALLLLSAAGSLTLLSAGGNAAVAGSGTVFNVIVGSGETLALSSAAVDSNNTACCLARSILQ